MKKVFTFLLIGVTVVMSLTMASYFVFTKFSPEREMRFMFAAMSQLDTAQQTTLASWSWENQQGEDVRTSLKIYGEFDQSSEEIEHDHEFQLVHLTENGDYQNLTAVLRKTEGIDYLYYQAPGPEIDGVAFDGRSWIEFNEGELDQWGSVLPGLNAPLELITTGWWETESLVRLRYLLRHTEIFHVEWNGLTQIVSGQNTRMMNLVLDETAAKAFFLDLIRAKEDREPTNMERIAADELAQQLSTLDYRFWIGTDDHLLYRLQIEGDLQNNDQIIPVEMSMELTNIGEHVALETPVRTTAFEQVYASAFGTLPSAEGATTSSSTQVVTEDVGLPTVAFEPVSDSDGDGLDDIVEGFYGTDIHNRDSDGDGMSDGEEVRTGQNPLGEGTLFSFGL